MSGPIRKRASLGALATIAACAPAPAEEVAVAGDAQAARVVLGTIRAAEAGDEAGFRRRIGRSSEPTFRPPAMADVDRTDEACRLRSIDASPGAMVSVLWSRANDTKPNVQRTFVVERGRVTYMWNDWAEIL